MKRIFNICIIALIYGLFLSACSGGSYLSDTDETVISGDETMEGSGDPDDPGEDDESGAGSSVVFAYVCGAVKKPGVYELPEGSRVYQAIDAAGGLLDDAADTAINQASLISDGDMIVVPFEGEEGAAYTGSATGESSDGRVNINQADSDLLQTLPGIGKTRAEAIIAYRDSHGLFSDIEELRQVDGIGEGIYSRIADRICV